MKRLSKLEMMDMNKPKTMEVELVDGAGVIIRSLKVDGVLELQKYLEDGKPTTQYFNHLVAMSVVNDELNPEYTPEDVSTFDSVILNKLVLAIVELNSMDKEAVRKVKEDFLAIQSKGSSSD